MLETDKIPIDIIQLITSDQAWFFNAIPVKIEGDTLTLATNKGVDSRSLTDEMEMITSYTVKIVHIEEELVKRALNQYYRKNDTQSFEEKRK